MARRSGQIIARGERKWLVRWHVGQDPATGKYKYKSKTVHGTKRDAQKYLNQVLRSQDIGTYVEPTKLTVNQYLDQWLDTAAKARVSERTFRDYQWLLDRYVRREVGDLRLSSLQPLDVQRVAVRMSEAGLSSRTVRLAIFVLKSALKQAVRWRMLAQNPAEDVDLPRSERREMRALSLRELRRLREAARGDRFEVLFDFLLATGSRPGEALALRWRDLHLGDGLAHIRQTISWAGPTYRFKEPKARSQRQIPLPPTLVRALRDHRSRQAERRLRAGTDYARDLDLVFATDLGTPIDERNLVQRHFKKALKAAKLPSEIRLYDLRHTMATMLLAAGENVKVVSERLGHASAKMTLDVYSHVLPGMQQKATERLEEALFG